MKRTFLFLASALFVALMAVSCNDAPKAEAVEEPAEEAILEDEAPAVEEEQPAKAAEEVAPKAETVNFDQYLDEYEKFVKSYEEMAENGGIDKANEVKQNAEAAKAKIKEDQLTDAQLARFKELNKRMIAASEKIAKKSAEKGKEAADKAKGLFNKKN
ncbi:MAG: hypothetical protein HUK15_04340 [Bacteroidales bacterium]|nr:hypothetical protein [Bacteroidales bacterium]